MVLSQLAAASLAMVSMALEPPIAVTDAVAVKVETLTFSDVEQQSVDFADILVTSYACEVLGYQVDYEGLADYGYEIHDTFVAFGMESAEAMDRLQGDIRQRRKRFNTYEGNFMNQSLRDFAFRGYSPQARFRHQFSRRCDSLATSQEVGFFITKPEDPLSLQELNAALLDLQSKNYRGR